MSSGPWWRFLRCAVALSACSTVFLAQNTEAKAPPVIDVHVHAMDGNFRALHPCAPTLRASPHPTPKGRRTHSVG